MTVVAGDLAALVPLSRASDAVLNIRGAATAAKMPIISTTTTSSTKLKAERLRAPRFCDVVFIVSSCLIISR